MNKEESVKNMEVNKGKYSVYKEKYDSVNFVGRAQSFRSADNATSIVRMRIFEWYLKNFSMPIVGLIPVHTPLKVTNIGFWYAFSR